MADKPSILIAEDERLFQEILAHHLRDEGYEITCFENGLDMLRAFNPSVHNLILLDLRLPDEDGIVIARQIRARSDVPIIVLTSDFDESTRINCLSLGVDDFLLKTVSPEELRLRIKNLLWRTGTNYESKVSINSQILLNDWSVDIDAMTVRHTDGREANLTTNEFKTLMILAQAKGRILSRAQILDGLSNGYDGPSDRMVDAYISRIRSKLENDSIIITVKGSGYKLQIC